MRRSGGPSSTGSDRPGAVLLLALVLSGCVGVLGSLREEKPLTFERQRLLLKHDGTLPDDVRRIEAAVQKAMPVLEQWGGLVEPVTVYLVNDHDTLVEAVHRRGFRWLRAWGRYDEVIFQAPSTWTKRDEPVDQLVLHELSHCLLFQRSATREDWLEKQIPLWFREGMALSIAGQAGYYPSLEDSAAWLTKNPTVDPFRDGEALSQDSAADVYAVALHAFTFLERRAGREGVLELMKRMRGGADFPTAFEGAIGVDVETFQRDFETYLRLRAFRFDNRTRTPQRPATGTDGHGM